MMQSTLTMRREIMERYVKLPFTDDFIFGKVLTTNLSLCRRLLEVILNTSIKEVKLAESQRTIELTSDGRGVRLDVYVNDEEGTVYNLEMQNVVTKALPKRSRYYQSMINLSLLERGQDYSELGNVVIIFICMTDPFQQNRPIYDFQCIDVNDTSIIHGDGVRSIYLNANGDTEGASEELLEFLSYLKTGVPKNGLCTDIANAVNEIHYSEKWRTDYMTLLMRDAEKRKEGRAEGLAEGRAEGLAEGRVEGLEASISMLKALKLSISEAYSRVVSTEAYSTVTMQQVEEIYARV